MIGPLQEPHPGGGSASRQMPMTRPHRYRFAEKERERKGTGEAYPVGSTLSGCKAKRKWAGAVSGLNSVRDSEKFHILDDIVVVGFVGAAFTFELFGDGAVHDHGYFLECLADGRFAG